MTSFLDAEYDDDTVTFHVDPLEWQDEDEYWAAVYTNSFQPYFAFTFKLVCDHPENDLTHYDGVEATCTEPGKHEVWYCDKCKKYFTDEGLTTRINEEDIDIPALGHAWEDGVCTRCGLRGTTTVEFIGEVPDRISDKSADTENSGLDYKFKVSKGVVSEVTIAEMVTSFNVDPAISIEQYASYFKFYKLDNTIYNGVSVPNYSLHIPGGNGANVIKKNDADYDLVQTDGTKGDKSKNSGRRFSTGEGQYYITKAGTDEPVIGLVWHNDEDKELSYGPMEAGEDGSYTIPAAKMIPDTTVTISVDKLAYEKVEDLIDAIPEIPTLEDEDAIVAAREAYDALTKEEKADVDLGHRLALLEAEVQLMNLKKAKAEEDAAAQALAEQELADAKAAAIDAVNAYAEEKKADADADAVKIAALEAVNKIQDADSIDDGDTIKTNAIAAIDNLVEDKANEADKALEEAKGYAINTIERFDPDDYVEADQETVATAIETCRSLIEAAETPEQVDDALDSFYIAIDDCKTQEEQDEEDFENAKANALAGIQEYADANKDKVDAKDLKLFLLEAEKLINEAESMKEVAQILSDTKSSIDTLVEEKTAADNAAEADSAAKKLAADKKDGASQINTYLAENLEKMYDDDKVNAQLVVLQKLLLVNDAESKDEIDKIVNDAKADIDAKVRFKEETEAAIAAAKANKVKGLKAKAKSKKFTVSWKKNADADGYQVQYKLKKAKKFSNLKKSTTKVKVKSKKLKKGQKYIFQVRTYKKVNGKKVYGKWVKTKAVKCK